EGAPGGGGRGGGARAGGSAGISRTRRLSPPVTAQSSVVLTGLADTAVGLWAVGILEFSCGEGQVCTGSYAALWNGTTWTVAPAGGGTGLSGVVAAGSKVLATSGARVVQLSPAGAAAQV